MSHSVSLITAPTDAVISLATCKSALGISGTDQDAMLQAAIDGAVSAIDAASGGYLGRSLRPQTWELRLDRFCDGCIELPFPPLIEIVSVKYDDAGGVEQTLVEDTDYKVLGLGGRWKQSIEPTYGTSWPAARCFPESVRIRFTAGYVTDPDAIPAAITSAIALGVRAIMSNAEQNLYLSQKTIEGVSSRSWVVSGAANTVVQQTVDNLLSTYRVW